MFKVLKYSLLYIIISFGATGLAQGGWTVGKERTVVLDLREPLGVQGHARLRKAVEYHGRYYCLFTFNSSLFSKRDGDLMYAFDTSSLEATLLPCPREFGHYKDDFFVRHDTLFLHIYGPWTKHDFWFDAAAVRWVECPKVDALVYEDGDYRIYEMDNGEWGQAMWFQDRRRGTECALGCLGAVRRVGERFFVVGRDLVRVVMTSQLDTAMPSMIDHRRATEDDYAIQGDTSPWLEGDTVYSDPRYDGFLSYIGKRYGDTVIIGSVDGGDGPILLVDRSDGTALMCIADRHRLQTVLPLGRRYKVDRSDLAPRVTIRTDRQVIPFQNDALSVGLIDVSPKRVKVLNISLTIDTLPVCVTDGLDSLLDFLEAGWGSLVDSDVLAYEGRHGSTFKEEDSLRSAYMEDIGFTDSICRTLRLSKRVDGLYNMGMEYTVRKDDRRVVAVFLGFSLPQPYMMEGSLWDRMGYDGRMQWYERQAAAMVARLESRYGEPTHREERELHWKRGSLTLVFYPSSCRLMIF